MPERRGRDRPAPRPGFVETRNQTVVSTSRNQISLDATRALGVSGLVSGCPAGSTFVRLDGSVRADSRNGAGIAPGSPAIASPSVSRNGP